jgi:serine phosphatase RsbU (regulator of sigma subunit)
MNFRSFWNKVSFIGISRELEFSHKEVVLLNKIVFLSAILMVALIPLEVIMNGWGLVPFEIGMSLMSGLALYFNYLKKYTLAKFYFYFVASGVIVTMGLLIGAGSGNELFLIPTFIFGAIMFDNPKIYIGLAAISFLLFCFLPVAQAHITPAIELGMEFKAPFKYVMYSVSFTILFFAIYYFKNINARFQHLLHSKNELIEEKNKEIVDSINYAERIQHAYLPPKELIHHYFNESFLFFKPKDIVSGDFYWFFSPEGVKGQKAETVYIIAADCTGHGVPGAIMSVICCNAINETIINKKVTDPGKILDDVRAQLIKILKTDEGASRKDGMDAVICKLDLNSKRLEFAGANNPLWILKKGSNEIEVVKADKQPVGFYEGQKPFTTVKLELNTGDRLFMFSDGYQDQFGGEKGKKFKAANLKVLLQDHKDSKMSLVHDEVSNTFNTWKGDLEQVDDVVLIGFELN